MKTRITKMFGSMVAGLIHDVSTCRVLIDRIMREAEEIVGRRLVGFVQGRVPA
jgi:nitronate monooxygenase